MLKFTFIKFLLLLLTFLPIASIAQDSARLKGTHFRKYYSIKNAAIKTAYRFSKLKKKEVKNCPFLKNYTLIFEDQFDSFNNKVWRKGQPWGRFNPVAMHQYYGYQEIYTKNGFLHLENKFRPQSFKSADTNVVIPYAVGLINSDISFTPKYGYFEIRCKMPQGPATWCAFWLTGKTRWPPEIDVFESYGGKSGSQINKQTQSVHWGISGEKSRDFLTRSTRIASKSDTLFHTYGCLWTSKYIKFYADGRLIRNQKVNRKMSYWLDEHMTIIINNGLEDKYLPQNLSNYKTSTMSIDWIKVYQLKEIN